MSKFNIIVNLEMEKAYNNVEAKDRKEAEKIAIEQFLKDFKKPLKKYCDLTYIKEVLDE